MGIEWYRDLFICIAGAVTCIMGLVAIGAIIYFTIIARSLNKKVNPIIRSVDEICTTVKDGVSDIRQDIFEVKEEIMSPLVQVMAIVQGVRRGFDLVNSFFGKEKRDEHA